MTKYNNSGWHKQHVRHVKAAKYGNAGGKYADNNYRLQYLELQERRNKEKQSKLTSYGLHNPIPNKIKGGYGDKINPKYLSQKELMKGIRVELEHTNKPKIAEEIATDHIVENPKYYEKLEKIEGKIKPIKIKTTRHEFRRAKNKLEQDLVGEIKKTKNNQEKEKLMHYYRELRKADNETKIKRFIKEYGNAISTIGIAIPIQLTFPLATAGIILAGGLTQEISVVTAAMRIGMPLTGIVISGEAIRHSIRTIKLIKKRQKEIMEEKEKELRENTELPEKEIKIISKRIAQKELENTPIEHELV